MGAHGNSTLKRLVTLAAALEIPTGLVLIFKPSIVTKLLFAGEMSVPGNALGPLAGFGLVALAVACWPSRADPAPSSSAVKSLLGFSFSCAGYLAYCGLTMNDPGPLLWPAAAGHAFLGLLLLRYWVARPAQRGR